MQLTSLQLDRLNLQPISGLGRTMAGMSNRSKPEQS